MNFNQVMKTLAAAGKPQTAQIYRRHGVREATFGVAYADLRKLQRKLKRDHELALQLWQSENHDARVLACHVADGERLTRKQLNDWMAQCSNYVICDAIATLVAQRSDAAKLAEIWCRRKGEWSSAAGWSVWTLLVMASRVDEAQARQLLNAIEAGLDNARNRTRHCMNGALIAVGGTLPNLQQAATAAARRIGPVVVDHGATGCKTPQAEPYILKMAQHREKRAGAKATSRP